jgi:hypothetical protein
MMPTRWEPASRVTPPRQIWDPLSRATPFELLWLAHTGTCIYATTSIALALSGRTCPPVFVVPLGPQDARYIDTKSRRTGQPAVMYLPADSSTVAPLYSLSVLGQNGHCSWNSTYDQRDSAASHLDMRDVTHIPTRIHCPGRPISDHPRPLNPAPLAGYGAFNARM